MTETVITAPDLTGSTHRLIASNRVEGTAVFNRDGEQLGRIEYFMVDKVSGRVPYAVMSFGGLFGIGDHHHPLPWSVLDYDIDRGGYVVDLDRETLRSGPNFCAGEEPDFGEAYGRRVYEYYGIELIR
jgi:hypothetical protein